jgi:hypothetical protein
VEDVGKDARYFRWPARADLAIDGLKDRRDDRLESYTGGRIIAGGVLQALLEEDRERYVAVLDAPATRSITP